MATSTRASASAAPSGFDGARGLWAAAGIFALSRALVLIAVATTTYSGKYRPGVLPGPDWWSPVPLQRWDAGHYQYIATFGYPKDIVDATAFLPAYPLTAWPLTRVMLPDLAMVIVASVESLLAILAFFVWARCVVGGATALIGVAILCAYPPAMFFSAGYPEGLRVLCLSIMLYCGTRGWWWRGALAGAAVTATHPTGVAIAAAYCMWGVLAGLVPAVPAGGAAAGPSVPLGLSPSNLRAAAARLPKFFVVGLVCAAGLTMHALYLWKHYERRDAFFASQSTWQPNPEHQHLRHALLLRPLLEPSFRPIKYLWRGQFGKLAEPDTWNRLLNLLVLVIAVTGLMRPGSIPRWSFLVPVFVFLLCYLTDPYNGTRLEGISRYQLAALPCFLWLAQWSALRSRPLAMSGVIAALLLLEILYVRAYVRWELAS